MRKSIFAILAVGFWAVAIAPANGGDGKGPECGQPPKGHPQPPLSAIYACMGKQESEKCEFKGPHDEVIAGTCFSRNHLKACHPSHVGQGQMQGPPPKPDFPPGPPQTLPLWGGPGSDARFSDGQCPCPRACPPPRSGFMAGRPFNSPFPDGPDNGPPPPPMDKQGQCRRPGPPPELLEACKDKQEGNACEFKTPWGQAISGACHAPSPKDALACLPKDGPPKDEMVHDNGKPCERPEKNGNPPENAK